MDTVPEIARALEVDRVSGYGWTEPFGRERDRRVAEALGPIPSSSTRARRWRPGAVLTQSGEPFSVFTPYARAFTRAVTVDPPRRAPRALPPLPRLPRSVREREVPLPPLSALGIARNEELVRGGESAARARLRAFLRGPAARYDASRDLMGEAGTSRLSQDLKFGTLSARTAWTSVTDALKPHPKARRAYLGELLWREFAYDVLWHTPRVLDEPFKPRWKGFPWRDDEAGWRAWVDGTTGYGGGRLRPAAPDRGLRAQPRAHDLGELSHQHLLIDPRSARRTMRLLTDGD